MKKNLLLILIIFAFIKVNGQLNPIDSLYFYHWYDYELGCPFNNCYVLDWQEPEMSLSDTLIGYNIYRGSELWRFQDYIGAGCSGSPCSDFSLIETGSFWIKVKAVYNAAHLESPAIDSVFFWGLETNIDQIDDFYFKILENPVKRGWDIVIQIENEQEKFIGLNVFNTAGVDVTTKSQTIFENHIYIPTSTFNSGIYNILIRFAGKTFSTRVIIIE
jgi:hypothetical protein